MTAPLRTPAHAAPLAQRTPSARPMYFGADERRVFGWYHAPRDAEARDCAVVLCAPHGYEGVCSYRALRHWAEALADAGIAVLRFDYHGCGDSSGDDLSPSRVHAWAESITDAIDTVRAHSGATSVVLAGVRLGGTLALAAAAGRSDVDALVLWATLPTGRAYLREGRAFTRLMTPAADAQKHSLPEGAEQIGGFVLTAETVAELSALDPLAVGRVATKRVLWIPRDDVAQNEKTATRLAELGVEVERLEVPGYAAMMADPHQSVAPTQMIAATNDWLCSRYALKSKRSRNTLARHDTELAVSAHASVRGASTLPLRPVHESPAAFGDGLFGIIAEPAAADASRRRTGILLANAGSVSRIGPNRLYVTLARDWASLGYTVLRMDLGGLGDSATPHDGTENHPYPSHAVRDIEQGVALLRSRGVSRVVVAGLCSGAHAAFHAANEIPDLVGAIVINPIVFYWKPSHALDLSAWLNFNESQHYAGAARKWDSWARLFTGKVDLGYVGRTMFTRYRSVLQDKVTSTLRALRVVREAEEDAARDLARISDRGTEVLLLFSEGEPGLDHLRRHHAGALRRLERRANFAFRVLTSADHTFTPLDARLRLAELLTAHVLEHHDHA